MLRRPHSAPRSGKSDHDRSSILKPRAAPAHPLDWLFEPLEDHPGYMRRKIFGCEAAYLNGRLMLVLAAGEEPWNGLLIATSREFHSALQARWEQLNPHPVLGKWLYLSQADPAFDPVATTVVEHVLKGDPKIGVDPKPRKRPRINSKKRPGKRGESPHP